MVLTTEGGRKLKCAICGGVIKNREQGGTVDTGKDIVHTDCWRERNTYEDAKEHKWLLEEIQNAKDKGATDEEIHEEMHMSARDRLYRWANFDKLPPNKYGARRVA